MLLDILNIPYKEGILCRGAIRIHFSTLSPCYLFVSWLLCCQCLLLLLIRVDDEKSSSQNVHIVPACSQHCAGDGLGLPVQPANGTARTPGEIKPFLPGVQQRKRLTGGLTDRQTDRHTETQKERREPSVCLMPCSHQPWCTRVLILLLLTVGLMRWLWWELRSPAPPPSCQWPSCVINSHQQSLVMCYHSKHKSCISSKTLGFVPFWAPYTDDDIL